MDGRQKQHGNPFSKVSEMLALSLGNEALLSLVSADME
jgi:hypothetical protein